jgi:hypothetical protein
MESDKMAAEVDVTEVDDGILRDLASRYADVSCPIHNEPPRFEVDEAGGVVERFCCEALLQIVRELQAREPAEEEAQAAEQA